MDDGHREDVAGRPRIDDADEDTRRARELPECSARCREIAAAREGESARVAVDVSELRPLEPRGVDVLRRERSEERVLLLDVLEADASFANAVDANTRREEGDEEAALGRLDDEADDAYHEFAIIRVEREECADGAAERCWEHDEGGTVFHEILRDCVGNVRRWVRVGCMKLARTHSAVSSA